MRLNKPEMLFGLLSMLLLVSNNNMYASADTEIPASVELALDAIKEADTAGADVSELVVQFNSATELQRQEQASDFSTCSSSDDCISAADTMFASIANDAAILKEQARKTSFEELIYSEVYAIAAAFVASFLGVFFYLQWKSFQQKRFLNSDIRER